MRGTYAICRDLTTPDYLVFLVLPENYLRQCSAGVHLELYVLNLTVSSKYEEEGIVVSSTCLNLRNEDRVTRASFLCLSKHDRETDTHHMSESERFGLMLGKSIHSWGFISLLTSTYCGHVKVQPSHSFLVKKGFNEFATCSSSCKMTCIFLSFWLPFFLIPWIYCAWVSFQLKSTYWEGRGIIAVGQKHFPSKKNVQAHKKDVGFLWIISCNFSLFSSYLLLRTESKKTKENYLYCEQKFAKLSYIIHLADLMSSWMQFANLHFGHKEIMHLLYMKKHSAYYKTIFCNCSGMLCIYVEYIYLGMKLGYLSCTFQDIWQWT